MLELQRSRLVLTTACLLAAMSAKSPGADSVVTFPDGIVKTLQDRDMRLTVYSPNVVRVTYYPAHSFDKSPSLSVIQKPGKTIFHVTRSRAGTILRTSRLEVRVSDKGEVGFFDLSGKSVLAEAPGGMELRKTMLPAAKPESAFTARASFTLPADESIYGLGQHQAGLLDYRNSTVTLEQHNMEVAIPFLVSSRGYGLLWDNPAFTTVSVNGPLPPSSLGKNNLLDETGAHGLTGRYFDGQKFEHQVAVRNDAEVNFDWSSTPPSGLGHDHYSVRWTGSVIAPRAGHYVFSTRSDDGARLFIDGKLLIDDWSVHAPQMDYGNVDLSAGKHSIKLEYFQGGGGAEIRLGWTQPSPPAPPTVAWKSEAANQIDYYFIYGPSLETTIASYRNLTGQAPMPGKWALGFWQSKERYNTQQEWSDILAKYRERHEPIDNIVQDWFYWNPHPWGSHWFDANRYPDPAAGVRRVHDQFNAHIMISVWGKFEPADDADPAGANLRTMQGLGFLYPNLGGYYDAFNPSARAKYWELMDQSFFRRGFDAWWLDASEPEVDMGEFRKRMTAHGLGARVLNAWPLEHTAGVYHNQRHETDSKRVFILTRSAYAGQQRNGAATWSGDITASWDVYAHQIPAGLNFCLSGIPYWTTDIGAFFVPGYAYPGGSSNPAYRELFTRWFQYGAFCPIFRVHGTDTPKELWRFGPNEPILEKYDRLRYRLMPYIYSCAWQVTHSGSTLMRALVMDFRSDPIARELKDEFMFGPSILVAPVIKPGATSRRVYLPAGTSWFNFWTGEKLRGGQWIVTPAPIDTLPLFVREGSILPMGPEIQYASEKSKGPIELRVYPGKPGHFTLYEDEGDNYNYEKGRYATTEISWDQHRHKLSTARPVGSYKGMPQRRKFVPIIVGSR